MKKGKFFWMAVIAAMVLVPTMVWAQAKTTTSSTAATEPSFFVEIYGGGGTATNSKKLLNNVGFNHPLLSGFRNNLPGDIDAYALGGVKLGYWFTPQGTYAASWYTDWMKYFGVYTDFSYQKLGFSNQSGSWNSNFPAWFGTLAGDTNGYVATWAFMLAARYGFLPDSQVPFGRLQPYVAVGPAIMFSSQRFNVNVTRAIGAWTNGINAGSSASTTVGLATELGLRYFFNKSVSVEASFKYRYFAPNYSFDGNTALPVPPFTTAFSVSGKPEFNLYSGQLGFAYHF
jgi:outer membrane protein W